MKNKKYKIGIIGGGSVGLTFAAFLAHSASVIVKTRLNEQAEQIKSQGINLKQRSKTGEEKEEVIHGIDATANMSDMADCDAIIITVKSYDTEKIAKELSSIVTKNTEILTVQNGLLGLPLLKKFISNSDRIFGGVTLIGATRLDERSVFVGHDLRTIIDAKATILTEVFTPSRFEFKSSTNIKQAIWDKMALNTAQNALGALTNLTLGEMGESEECLFIGQKLLEEFEKVAVAEGLHFEYSLMQNLNDNWNMSKHHPSMWQDLQNKKQTEIDAINGAISSLGKKHKIATPYNDMITSLIKIIEKN